MGAANSTAVRENTDPLEIQLMEVVVGHENMKRAYSRVKRNKGAAGVDRMTLAEHGPHLKTRWLAIKEALLEGRYQPQAVLRVDIPKPGGKGVRTLSVPTVIDRLIQQALHQVLQPIFEPGFSNASYGFRPGRSAHQALRKAQMHVADGHRWVVDMDLEKFFDKVNHDILMSRIARKVEDGRVLKLIRRTCKQG